METNDSQSVLTKKQVRIFTGTKGLCHVISTVRWDDQCGNGHNTFSITGEVYGSDGNKRDGCVTINGINLGLESWGCCHDDIARVIPELAPYIKWHLCSSDGPLHYITNTLYLAGDRDCHGLRKGESRQIRNGKTGKLSWILSDVDLPKYIDADERPTETQLLSYEPWCRIGEGKARELDSARSVAIWPEATDEELMQEPKELEKALMARLPQLMADFRKAIEELGFIW